VVLSPAVTELIDAAVALAPQLTMQTELFELFAFLFNADDPSKEPSLALLKVLRQDHLFGWALSGVFEFIR
jgi:hypothetical protein